MTLWYEAKYGPIKGQKVDINLLILHKGLEMKLKVIDRKFPGTSKVVKRWDKTLKDYRTCGVAEYLNLVKLG